jgi:RNA polymerase sigma-70 factor, ECF subfamily
MNAGLKGQDSGASLEFEALVNRFYQVLYQFAFSLTRSEADACDLTQQTFCIWAEKGDQLRDATKVKSWLFTSLHRVFLQSRRRQTRFPHFEIGAVDSELPPVSPPDVSHSDSAQVLEALGQLDEIYRAPLALFYLDDCPYKEIAETLNVPLGTVKSRIARGIAQLQQIMAGATVSRTHRKTVSLGPSSLARAEARLCDFQDSQSLKAA